MRYWMIGLWAGMAVTSAFAGTGETGFAFMKIGVDARAAGMGEAVSSMSTDATAWFWNPAGLAMSDKGSAVFTHNQWIEDVSHNFIGLKLNTNGHYFGLHYIATGVSNIEQREIPSDEPTALFASHDLTLGFTYARKLDDQWAVGANINYVYERIQHSVDALGFDAGVWYTVKYAYDNPNMDNRWRVGLVLSNFGFSGKLVDETVDLPQTIRLGSSYDFMRPADLHHRLTGAIDLVKPLEEDLRIHFGAEYVFREKVFLRAGYQVGYESKNISGGVGMRVWDRLRLDYAVVPFKYSLGLSHRLTAAFEF